MFSNKRIDCAKWRSMNGRHVSKPFDQQMNEWQRMKLSPLRSTFTPQLLFRQLTERDEQIDELESKINKLRKWCRVSGCVTEWCRIEENSVDHEQLLQSMHEDKTTLSRAIAQNKQLKEQLIELQDGFVKMVRTDFTSNEGNEAFSLLVQW